MGIFDAFTPEGLMRALGIDPAEMVAMFQRLNGDLEGFKAGMSQTIVHFNNKLEVVIANQQRMEEKLDLLLSTLLPNSSTIIEGVDYERNQ